MNVTPSAHRRTKTGPNWDIERDAAGPCIAGVDEAGRGPLAGPVIAAAVVLDPARLPEGIDDSKTLNETERERLFAEILSTATVGIGTGSVAEVDRINILQASLLAMRRAVTALAWHLGHLPDLALVDGNRSARLACPERLVVGGDGLSLSIAAASIVAKVTRDSLMTALAADHPGYRWETNRGYATAHHRLALTLLGPTPHHRRSFAPLRPPSHEQLRLTL